MTETTQEENIIRKVSKISVANQLVETHFVDSSSGYLESATVSKSERGITETNLKIEYALTPHKLIVKPTKEEQNIVFLDVPSKKTIIKGRCVCECVSINVNRSFINEMKSFKNTVRSSYSYFDRGFLSKMVFKKTPKDLADQVSEFGKDSSWAIVSKRVYGIIKDFVSPEPQEGNHLIRKVGKLNSIDVYLYEESEHSIYFGNYDSVTLVINRNVRIGERDSSNTYTVGKDVNIDYAFISNSPVKILRVD